MPQKALEIRVENLENTVASQARLPQQLQELSSQFLQLHQEVKADISGVRTEVREVRAELGEVRAEVGELRAEVGEVRAELGEVRADVGGLRTEVGGLREDVTGLRGEMYSIRDELRVDMASMHKDLANAIVANGVEMRALHEAVIERITLLGEYRNGGSGSSNPAGGRS